MATAEKATRKKKKKVAVDESLLIKGYLPVRVRFPPSPTEGEGEEEERVTFFYVKEHQHWSGGGDDSNTTIDNDKDAPTLFVANAPSHPPIDTPTLLKALLGRFGHIARVTVVPHPRRTQQQPSHTATASHVSATPNPMASWYFTPVVTDRFAHVLFASRQDLQKCIQALQAVMRTQEGGKGGGLTVDAIERQTLTDVVESRRNDKEAEDKDPGASGETTGIQRVYQDYLQQHRRHQNREALLAQCNAIMEEYEQRERERIQAMSSEPDADGFITVTHATQPAVDTTLDEGHGRQQRSSVSRSRSRKRKKGSSGALPQDDFYRFQTKEKRKQDVQTLRERFQQDLERIQKIKEQGGGFQPFGRKKE